VGTRGKTKSVQRADRNTSRGIVERREGEGWRKGLLEKGRRRKEARTSLHRRAGPGKKKKKKRVVYRKKTSKGNAGEEGV